MPVLPADFADLEPYAEWALPTAEERYDKRLASSMDSLQAFYDAAFGRIDDALAHLDRFELDAMPDDAVALLQLYESLMTVSFPIEVWRQTKVPDSGAAEFVCLEDLKP
jgi:hypothetical protein